MISPARVATFGDDGKSVVLDDGSTVPASAVVLATGYKSTWRPIFDGELFVANLANGRALPYLNR